MKMKDHFLHPIFEGALKPFAPPPAQALPTHTLTRENVTLEVSYEFEPAQVGAREPLTGLQLEPDIPAGVTIVEVLHQGENIAALLPFEAIDDMEREVLQWLGA